VRLVGAEFDALLNDVGQEFLWRKATACPCLNPHSGQPKSTCTHCGSKGRIWASPIQGKSGVISRSQQKKMAGFGVYDEGDIMLSIPSDSPIYAIGMYDRIQALHRTEPFSVVLLSGINDVIKFTPTQIDSVTWIDANDAVISGTVPAIVNGALVWSGVVPPAKVSYALSGRRALDYYCYQDLPLDRPHQFGEKLPRRVVLRRFDLFGL